MEGGRMRVSKPPVRGELDDQATAFATAAAMIMSQAQGFPSLHWEANKSTARGAGAGGPVVDAYGTRYLGDGVYRAESGEIFRDPRGV